MNGPYDEMTNILTFAKTPMPQISMEEVNLLLDGFLSPSVEGPSLLEVRFELVPPILRAEFLHLPRKLGQHTRERRTHIPAAHWETRSCFVREQVEYIMELAERRNLADRGPSGDDLKGAPALDLWVPISGGRDNRRLAGLLAAGPDGEPGTEFLSELWALNLSEGWALTKDGWRRLGRRISGWEYQKLCPPYKYHDFREYDDAELVYTLLADRERIAWWLGQLRLPPT